MSTAPPNFEKRLKLYLERVQSQNSEAAKLFTFLDFIRDAFKEIDADTLEKSFPELERYLSSKSKTVVVRGRVDAFLGNLIIEFKKKLDRDSLPQAESELRRYISILWTHEKRKRVAYVTLASDGVSFVAYRPRAELEEEIEPEDVFLDEIDKIDLSRTETGTAFLWLDRYMLSQELKPATAEAFSNEFGLNKPVFNDAVTFLREAWKETKESVLYDQWASFLRIVYGSRVDSEELFLRHTYLATLAKLLAYSSFSGGALPVSSEQITEILEGRVFEKWNIHNFLEEDFFSWLGRSEIGVQCARVLLNRLADFTLSTIDEDILKSLYQELVDPQSRHDLGEYYTPDWLAEFMVQSALGNSPEKSVLDPACGSGTFLAATIRRKKELLKKKKLASQLEQILDSTSGVDIHPLAVILSRSNFLTALGTDLLSARKGDISIPVYMADSLRLPESDIVLFSDIRSFRINAEKKVLRLPIDIAVDPNLTDRAIEGVKEYAKNLSGGDNPSISDLEGLLKQRIEPALMKTKVRANELTVLLETSKSLSELINVKKDTVWAFILKNLYKPLFLRDKKFDILIGNPPWLAYRFVDSVDYQKFLKESIINKYHLLGKERAELITQMELATLFFARTSDLYLSKDGIISFVMPRGIFVGDQHHNFRKGTFEPKMKITEFIDLEDVEPLFHIPSCVVTAKRGRLEYPIQTIEFQGRLDQRNTKLKEAVKLLKETKTKFRLYEIGQRSFLESQQFERVIKTIEGGKRSPYFESFTQGATIVPRSVWFVEPVIHRKFGIDPNKPNLQTSQRAIDKAKEDYVDVRMQGEVESRFLYGVATGSELAPFSTTSLPIVVLPIEPSSGTYRIIRADEARRTGYTGLGNWLLEAEKIWADKRGEKANETDLYGWLNFENKLTGQNSRTKFRVLYNHSGTYLVCCVLENRPYRVKVDSVELRLSGVIADAKAYRYDTNDYNEAMFIAAVLNAPIIDALIKPMQSRGQWGARDIHKKVLELPIPRFNEKNPKHMELVALAKKAHTKAEKAMRPLETKYTGIAKIRRLIKAEIAEEILQIDKIVRQLLFEAGNLPNGLEDYFK